MKVFTTQVTVRGGADVALYAASARGLWPPGTAGAHETHKGGH